MLHLLLALSCSGSDPEPVAPPPPAPVQEPDPAEIRYVQASVLKLRDQADATSGLKGRLPINTQLEILERADGFAHVKLANGVDGWVSEAFIGAERLTVEECLAKLPAEVWSATPQELEAALPWAQRAAAIEASHRTLEPLRDLYKAQGDERRAGIVDVQLAFPESIKVAARPWEERVVVEYREVRSGPWKEGDLSPAELRDEGITLGETWWVLPAQGPAVQGAVQSAVYTVFNECGGSWGIELNLDVSVDTPIAVTRGEPPASWHTAGPAPEGTEEQAVARATAYIQQEFGTDAHVMAAPAPNGWRVQAFWLDPESESVDWYDEESLQVHLLVNGDRVTVLRKESLYTTSISTPYAFRDVDGDGDVDGAYGNCPMQLVDADGSVLTQGDNRCCGC